MPHIAGHDRSPGSYLLPESLDDYVGPENPVRFIEAFVEGLDLPAAGFARVEPEETGRPGYRPADLLKLYIYGYLNRNRSSRRLEAETDRNIEVIWLLRHLKPDFKAIADFRRDNRKAFRPVFRQFVLLCKQLDLFGRERQPAHGRAPPGRRVPRCERVHIAPGAHTGRRCRCRISTLWKVRGGIRMQPHKCRCRPGRPSGGLGRCGRRGDPQQQTDHQALPEETQELSRHPRWLSLTN